ncbi:MAG: hypothetical protein IPK65_03110, partial [Gammaproteobacteria bacterium]|nr:hypothetical protein [Gammaproteobacteria bacterium]
MTTLFRLVHAGKGFEVHQVLDQEIDEAPDRRAGHQRGNSCTPRDSFSPCDITSAVLELILDL